MKIVTFPHLPPFCCGKCGATEGTRDYWIDTDIDAEVPSHADGRVFICNMCILDLATIDPQLIARSESDKLLAYQNEFVLKAQDTQKAWETVVVCFANIGIDLVKVWEISGFGNNKLIESSLTANSKSNSDHFRTESDNSVISNSEPDPLSLFTLDK